jgi:hypothetical protein
MKSVLIVSHNQEQCGVYQYGYNTAKLLEVSNKYNFHLVKTRGLKDLVSAVDTHKPVAIIYNYHVSTLGWLNDTTYKQFPGIKQLVIHHEPHQPVPPGYHAIISQDPSAPEGPGKFSAFRPLYAFSAPPPRNPVPVIGSFGFGMAGKGFDRLVGLVCDEFEEAQVKINIPFAFFGDAHGRHATDWAKRAYAALTNSRVQLLVTHHWWNTDQLLNFLSSNDLNAFLYDDMGRGVSSVLDFAISARRPLAITRSTMFQHVWSEFPHLTIESSPLNYIMQRGIGPVAKLYEMWQQPRFVANYERIIDESIGTRTTYYSY